jgi:Uncharacterized protein conserved in bacteria (DUF2330)
MPRRLRLAVLGATLVTILTAAPALACGGLIGPNGAVNLLRTTTFVGYHDGVEHYVTAFQFAGGGGAFGSITPLPAVPTKVEKGGDWTLQRLVRETEPVDVRFSAAAAAEASGSAEVLMQVKVDALNITVLKGGAAEVGQWATEHGFRLPPDAPEVLEFYARRSQIFLAAAFDADAAQARGQRIGDGTPVHITMPTTNPWVPIRILALGKTGTEPIQADVYMLTDRTPVVLPAPIESNGLNLDVSEAASSSLLADLRSDRGMEWIPSSGWLTKIGISGSLAQLTYDLAVDASGLGVPSRVAAGLELPATQASTGGRLLLATLLTLGAVLAGFAMFRRASFGFVRPA